MSFALGPTDWGLNPVWSVRQGRESEESGVCPGFNGTPLSHTPQVDPGSVLSLKRPAVPSSCAIHHPTRRGRLSCLSGSRGLDGVMLPGVGRTGKLRVWRFIWTVFEA